MAEISDWSVEYDYAQTRVRYDAQTVLVQGGYPGINGDTVVGYDAGKSSDVYVDPVTFTLFRRPGPLYEAWNTTGTGIYARLQKSAFTLSTPSAWEDDPTAFATDYWLRARNLTAAQSGVTTTTWGDDTGFWVGYYLFNDAPNEYEVLRVGWHTVADYLQKTSVRLYSSGRAEVYRDGLLVGSGEVSGSKGGAGGGQEFVGVLLLPCRGRELLLVGTGGNGFSVAFDVAEGAPIIPSSPFWFLVPQLGTKAAKVQVAQLQYNTTGVAVSLPLTFSEPPQAGQVQGTQLYSDGPGTVTVAVRDANDSADFVADGVAKDCRVRFTLSGTAGRTQSVYAAAAGYSMERVSTGNDVIEVLPYVTRMTLSVSESPESVTCDLDLARLPDIDAAGVDRLRSVSNRPVLVSRKTGGLQRTVILGGRTAPLEWDAGFDESVDEASVTLLDRWSALENYTFRDPYPLDGLTLEDAVKVLVEPAGLDPANVQVEASGFTIPKGTGMSRGEFSFLIEVGDKASEGLRRLFDAYAPDWFYGFVPFEDVTRFIAVSPAGLPTTPAVTLFPTTEQAIAQLVAEGFDERSARTLANQRTFREYRERHLEPEANLVYVTGYDPRKNAPIQAYKADTLAMDPTLVPADRPVNWVGERRPYGYIDPALTSQDLVNAACEALFRKLSWKRILVEVLCEALYHPTGRPVWRGDCIELDGFGLFRVQSFATDLVKAIDWDGPDPLGKWQSAPTRYALERIDVVPEGLEAWRGGSLLPGVDAIALAQERRRKNRAVPGLLGKPIIGRPPATREEL